MESQIKTLPGINQAFVNFGTSTLAIEAGSEHLEKLEEEIKRIVQKYEPDVIVSRKDAQDKAASKKVTSRREELQIDKLVLIRLGFGITVYLAALLLTLSPALELGLYGTSYLLFGGEVVFKALHNIIRGQVFDENFLMTVATIGAFTIQEYPEAVAVMLFYQIGTLFENMAVNRSRRSIQALLDIRPDYANLKRGEEIIQVSPGEVAIGDTIMIKPGERVPLDGKIIEGRSLVDTSALTGESVPRDVKPGDGILGGFINTSGVLFVEVTKEFGESTVAKILDLVQNAAGRKATTENFITKFARYYTPVVVTVAAALAFIPPLVVPGAAFSDWLYRALIFLVISCPCALVVSIPLGFFGGIGGASRSGILVKGSNYLAAGKLKLDEYHAELLPHEKVARIEEIYTTKGKGSLIFVGDGINDVPVLARADVGVAMGGLGSDAAIEAADVVIMTDEPSKLVSAIRIAGRTRSIVWQNIILALVVKGIVLALGAGGAATLWEAVFADAGVAVIAILNAMQVLRAE
jgi:Cd2+/Zn2+-exporting ATPase